MKNIGDIKMKHNYKTLESLEWAVKELSNNPALNSNTYQGIQLRKDVKEAKEELADLKQNKALCFHCKCIFHIDEAVIQDGGETYCSEDCMDVDNIVLLSYMELLKYKGKADLKIQWGKYNLYIVWIRSRNIQIYRIDNNELIDIWILTNSSLKDFKDFCKRYYHEALSNPKHKIHERAKIEEDKHE